MATNHLIVWLYQYLFHFFTLDENLLIFICFLDIMTIFCISSYDNYSLNVWAFLLVYVCEFLICFLPNTIFYLSALRFVLLPIPLWLSFPKLLWFHLFMENFHEFPLLCQATQTSLETLREAKRVGIQHSPFVFTIFSCHWLFFFQHSYRWYIHKPILLIQIEFILIPISLTQSYFMPFNSQFYAYFSM